MENLFEQGDRVFHILYGWGKVVSDNNDSSGVGVKFDNEEKPTFIFGVKLLSFTEYTLEGATQERPETLPEKGQVVWVRDDEDDEWLIAHFVQKEGRFYGTTDANPFAGIIETNWKYLTTENPYKNEN